MQANQVPQRNLATNTYIHPSRAPITRPGTPFKIRHGSGTMPVHLALHDTLQNRCAELLLQGLTTLPLNLALFHQIEQLNPSIIKSVHTIAASYGWIWPSREILCENLPLGTVQVDLIPQGLVGRTFEVPDEFEPPEQSLFFEPLSENAPAAFTLVKTQCWDVPTFSFSDNTITIKIPDQEQPITFDFMSKATPDIAPEPSPPVSVAQIEHTPESITYKFGTTTFTKTVTTQYSRSIIAVSPDGRYIGILSKTAMNREELRLYEIETGQELFKVEADFTISLHQITKQNFVFFSIYETDYVYYLKEKWYKPIRDKWVIDFFQIDEQKNEILIGSSQDLDLTIALEKLAPANFHEYVCFSLFSGIDKDKQAERQQLYLELLKTDTFYKILEARYYELLEMFDIKEVE